MRNKTASAKKREIEKLIAEQRKNEKKIYVVLVLLALFSLLPAVGAIGTFAFIFVWIRYLLKPKIKIVGISKSIDKSEREEYLKMHKSAINVFALAYVILKIVHIIENIIVTLGVGLICTAIVLPIQVLFILWFYKHEKNCLF